jgi:hypothetical protein
MRRALLLIRMAAGNAFAADPNHDLVSVRDAKDVLVAVATADKWMYENPAVSKPARPNYRKASNCIASRTHPQDRAGLRLRTLPERVEEELHPLANSFV